MTEDILTSLKSQLADAEGDVARLRQAIAVLEPEQTVSAPKPARKPAPKPVRTPRAKRAPRRSAEVVPLGKLLAQLQSDPGVTTAQLATATNGNPPAILSLLKEAEEKGTVRREGQRRATKWWVVTDEDRVAARAAEIAAQAAAKPKRATRTRARSN